MLPNNMPEAQNTAVDISPSKSILSTLLLPSVMSRTSSTTPEGRNTKISPVNSDDCPREGIAASNNNNSGNTNGGSGKPTNSNGPNNKGSYHTRRYAHLTSSTATTNYTTHQTKSRTGRRCYRLNLERPFNIHCEQSPLEYGDIFKPWEKAVRPKTRGPTEYCPPRHLGGREGVWRTMLTFDDHSGSNGGGEEVNNMGWRTLTPQELSSVKRLGERNEEGEYSFVTYDLVHVRKRAATNNNNNNGGAIITPTTSIDSEDSTPISPTQKANETARLFRRSELSLREKAEEEQRREAAEREKAKLERKEKERQELEELKSIKGPKGLSRRMSKRASLRGKNLVRKLSSSLGTSSTSSASTRTLSGRGGIYEGGVASRRKLVSMQAGMIEKARDLIDEESGDEYDGEKYDDTKKVTNVSLYIVGEYDILNDLCLDGGPRLKNSQNLSDLELLLQNDPCPPPNRWVRKTGWGKCNPSSMYAECPPEGFDLVGYGKRDGPVRVNPVPRPVMEVKS